MEQRKTLQFVRRVVIGALLVWNAHAQAQEKNGGAATFTAAQAAQGKSAYAQSCAQCHGQNLDDGEFASPLKGAYFGQQWAGKPADDLFTIMRTRMPPANPGGLTGESYAQIFAWVLQ